MSRSKALTSEQRAQLRADTRSAAAALLEDVEYVRRLLEDRDFQPHAVRHLTVILRRWLVEDVLQTVSTPRLPKKFEVDAVDNNPTVKASRKARHIFIFTGGMPFEATIEKVNEHLTRTPVAPGRKLFVAALEEAKPGSNIPSIKLNLQSFARQPVMALRGEWVRRYDVVQYIASVGHGVHSRPKRTEADDILDQISQTISSIPKPEGGFTVTVSHHAEMGTVPPFTYDPKRLNPVLVELLITADILVKSVDMDALLVEIRRDLGIDADRP